MRVLNKRETREMWEVVEQLGNGRIVELSQVYGQASERKRAIYEECIQDAWKSFDEWKGEAGSMRYSLLTYNAFVFTFGYIFQFASTAIVCKITPAKRTRAVIVEDTKTGELFFCEI